MVARLVPEFAVRVVGERRIAGTPVAGCSDLLQIPLPELTPLVLRSLTGALLHHLSRHHIPSTLQNCAHHMANLIEIQGSTAGMS